MVNDVEFLNLISCDSLELLADRLNTELLNGRALRFHNNDGIFLKDTENPVVYEFIVKDFYPPSGLSEEVRNRNMVGVVQYKSMGWEKSFFKPANVSNLFSHPMPSINLSDPILIYGLINDSLEERRYRYIGSQFDSSDYGPESGLLVPREVEGLFDFKGLDRIYWQRT
jgi:hypothetical protein